MSKTSFVLFSGPTVYVPIVFRNRVLNIYTSDYAEANRRTLESWYKKHNRFDWVQVCQWIADIESSKESPEDMQETTRSKLRAILNVINFISFKTNFFY